MKIVKHQFVDGWHARSPNIGGALVKPSLLVMHFTASGATAKGIADYFMRPEVKVSAHITICRDGTVKQVVPFDRIGFHAGKSVWRGRAGCNAFSVGIELCNWGRVQKGGDGAFRSWTNTIVPPAHVAQLRHRNEARDEFWETYPEAQFQSAVEVARAILAAYPSITEIVGHDDIAPFRKADPGPAFPMDRFRSFVIGRDEPEIERTVIASNLNVGGGAGTEFGIVGTLPKGTKVDVLYDAPGRWARIEAKDANGKQLTGWVVDQYLA